MNITLNGQPTEVPEHTSVAQLVEQLDLVGKRIAVELNEDIVPRGRYAEQRLSPGDRVEIVHAIGGG